jgi:hypothetical protein
MLKTENIYNLLHYYLLNIDRITDVTLKDGLCNSEVTLLHLSLMFSAVCV